MDKATSASRSFMMICSGVCFFLGISPPFCASKPNIWPGSYFGGQVNANASAIKSYNEDHDTAIIIRQVKYLNNIVEQDHRGVKRVIRPMLGFKSFDAAQSTLAGIELMHMLEKRQLEGEVVGGRSVAEQFYGLAA